MVPCCDMHNFILRLSWHVDYALKLSASFYQRLRQLEVKRGKIPLPWKMEENPWSIPCVQQQVPPNPASKTHKKVDLPEKESNINSINFCFTSVKFWKECNKAYCIKAGCAKRYLINVRVTSWNKSFVINYKWCKQRCILHPYHRKIKYQIFFSNVNAAARNFLLVQQ